MIGRLLVTLACLVLLTAPAHARESAAAREAQARQAFRRGEYERAARAFAEAFRIDPRAATKYNEALAWSRADEHAAAADAYEAALELGGLDERLSRASSDRLAKLKNQLGVLVVRAPLGASVSVAHAPARSIPARIHLPPGEHEVRARLADGSERTIAVRIQVGAEEELSLPEPALAPEPPPEERAPVEPPEDATAMPVAGGTLLGLGGAALVAMAVTGGLTLAKVSEYDEGGNRDVALYDEAIDLRTATNVLLGVGAGLAAVGLTLVVVAAVDDETAAAIALGTASTTLRIDW